MQDHATARHVDIDGERLRLRRLGLEDLSLSLAAGWLVSSCQLPHEGVSTVIVKVDASDISVIQGTGARALFVIPAAGAIEIGRRLASAAGARESGSLVLLILALESP